MNIKKKTIPIQHWLGLISALQVVAVAFFTEPC